MVAFILTATLALWLVPDVAWAWGPVTHLWHGTRVLSDLHNLPAALQQLLIDQHWQYLYGCVAADIIQVKRYTRTIYTHCHGWRMGWKILQQAETPEERAFAHGYLSHLAADVYSHNYFVPIQLVASFPSRTQRHIYWEARFDAEESREERSLLKEVLARRSPACDALVERVLERTLFSFRTNKRIFRSVVALQRLDRWHAAFRRLTSRSRVSLPGSEVNRYNQLCVASIRDLLANGEQAAVMHHDPIGRESLRQAKDIRRKLHTLRRRDVPVDGLRDHVLRIITEARNTGDFPDVSRFTD